MEYHLESYTMLLLKQEVHEYPHCLIVSHSSRRLAVLIIVLIKRKEADLTECGARLLLDYTGWSCLWACFVWSVAYEKVITVSLAAETFTESPFHPFPTQFHAGLLSNSQCLGIAQTEPPGHVRMHSLSCRGVIVLDWKATLRRVLSAKRRAIFFAR